MLSQILNDSTYGAVKTLAQVKLTSMLLNMCYCYHCSILDKMEKKNKALEKKNHSILKARPVSGDLYVRKLFIWLIFEHIFPSFHTCL